MSQYIWGDGDTEFFYHLTPEVILSAMETLGLKTTGRCLTLNSMENRVYEIEVDRPLHEIKSASDTFLVTKFYRPGRWSQKQILEEHQFLFDLQEAEVPVIAPLKIAGESLFKTTEHNLWYTIFPKKGGRLLDEPNEEQFAILGRMLARLHNVGASRSSLHRVHINPENFGLKNLEFLLEKKMIPAQLQQDYEQVVRDLCTKIDPLFKNIPTHRLHGDCHFGNIIWRPDEGPFFIDFDDMLVGPAMQDLWLQVSGMEEHDVHNKNILLDSYDSMRTLDYNQIKLMEPLRSLRMIHFSAWIAKRWEDESFKRTFVNFGTEQYWQTQLHDLSSIYQKI